MKPCLRVLVQAFAAALMISTPWCGGVARAAWHTNGVLVSLGTGRDRPNDQLTGIAILPDGAGGVFVVWCDCTTGIERLRALRLTSDGEVAGGWPTAGVAVSGFGSRQLFPKLVSDGSGGAVIAWWGSSILYAQRVKGDGTLPWGVYGVVVNDTLQVDGFDLAPDGSGGVFLAWNAWDVGLTNSTLASAHLDANGQPRPGWPIHGFLCPQAVDAVWPSVVPDGAGGEILFWSDRRDPPGFAIFSQHYNADGVADPAWPIGGLEACHAADDRLYQIAVSDGVAGAVAAWPDWRNGSSNTDLYAQHVTAGGAIAPGWTLLGTAVSAAPSDQGNLDNNVPAWQALVSDDHGGLIAAWSDTRTGGYDIYAQRITTAGAVAPGWVADGIPACDVTLQQQYPIMARDGSGGAFVGWFDHRNGTDFDVYLSHLAADGTLVAGWPGNGEPVCNAPGDQTPGAMCEDGAGGVIMVWEDFRRGDLNHGDIYAARVLTDATVGVLASLVSADAEADGIHLRWSVDSDGPLVVTVERRVEAGGWSTWRNATTVGRGEVNETDSDVSPGGRYGYRLRWTDSGTTVTAGESWVEVPARPALDLAVVGGVPSRGGLALRYSLPASASARVEVFDASGRVMARRESGGIAGSQVWQIAGSPAWAPGIYWARLTQGGAVHTARAVLTH
ncbi:MAG: hypothetical protein ACHQ52_03230 [Candidatus Eisenbacteria bacterium]